MKQAIFTLTLSILPALVLSGCCTCYNSTSSCAEAACCKPCKPLTCKIQEDDLGYDPKLEVCHLYYDQWPTGIAISKCGRKFSCYPSGLDIDNTNNGCNCAYQVAELIDFDKECPYPDIRMNNPPGGAIDYTQRPPVTKGLPNYFLSVNSLTIDCNDLLWVLDTGQARGKNHLLYPASPGGTKLCSFDLCTDFLIRTYTFPSSITQPTSYFINFCIDTKNKKAYILDANEYKIVVLDLCSGGSWPALEKHPSVVSAPGSLPFVWGTPSYITTTYLSGDIVTGSFPFGVVSRALSADAKRLYYSQLGSRVLHSVDTACLQKPCTALNKAAATVQNHGERGVTHGMECDSRGIVWSGNAEQDAISMFCPSTRKTVLYIRDKRINYAYSLSAAFDGYMYFTVNQLNKYPIFYPGEGPLFQDSRQKPYALFRFKLPGNATKICYCGRSCSSCC